MTLDSSGGTRVSFAGLPKADEPRALEVEMEYTDPNGQICDQGPSYRTAVFTTDATEKAQAEQVKAEVGKELRLPIKTMILGPTTFWMGEGYHQHYAEKNPAAYMTYRFGCGRDRTLRAVWAKG